MDKTRNIAKLCNQCQAIVEIAWQLYFEKTNTNQRIISIIK